jgi:hypothetical protein
MPRMESLSCIHQPNVKRSNPCADDFLDMLHELEETNSVLHIALGVCHPGRPRDACAEQTWQFL